MTFKLFFSTSILFFFFGTSTIVVGQIDKGLLKHFIKNGLDTEHVTYLKTVNCSDDSVQLFFAKYYVHNRNWEKFLDIYKSNARSISLDTNFLNFITVEMLALRDSARTYWFEKEVGKYSFLTFYDSIYKMAFNYERNELDLPDDLHSSFSKFLKVKRKSPLLAAALSTLVPGLGKIYIGNYRTGFFSLFSISVFGVQALESYKIKGLDHLLTLTNIGFFAGYYSANIVGSYRDTKVKKVEYRNQFLIDASNYFKASNGIALY